MEAAEDSSNISILLQHRNSNNENNIVSFPSQDNNSNREIKKNFAHFMLKKQF